MKYHPEAYLGTGLVARLKFSQIIGAGPRASLTACDQINESRNTELQKYTNIIKDILYTEKYTEIERYKGESENTIFTTEGEICKCQESNQYGRLKDKIKGRRRRRGESQGVSSIVNIPVYPVRRFRRTRN